MDNSLNINGTLVPKDETIPTHVDIYGLGGMRVVETTTDMEKISPTFKKDGMLVNVVEEDALYKWNDDAGNWEMFKITNEMIEENSIDGARIIENSIPSDRLKNNSISEIKLAYGSITSAKIKERAIKGTHIAKNTISSDQLSKGCITVDAVAPYTITGDKLKNDSIPGEKILNNSLDGSKIKTGTIEENKLGNGVTLMTTAIIQTPKEMTVPVSTGDTSVKQESIYLGNYFDSSFTGRNLVYLNMVFPNLIAALSGDSSYHMDIRVSTNGENIAPRTTYGGAACCIFSNSDITQYTSSSGDNVPTVLLIGETDDSSNLIVNVSHKNEFDIIIYITPLSYIPLKGQ